MEVHSPYPYRTRTIPMQLKSILKMPHRSWMQISVSQVTIPAKPLTLQLHTLAWNCSLSAVKRKTSSRFSLSSLLLLTQNAQVTREQLHWIDSQVSPKARQCLAVPSLLLFLAVSGHTLGVFLSLYLTEISKRSVYWNNKSGQNRVTWWCFLIPKATH